MGACQGALVVYTVFIPWDIHGLPKKNLDLYLSEFCFRFNRRSMNLFEHLAAAVGCSFLSKRDNHILKLESFATRCEALLPYDRERCII